MSEPTRVTVRGPVDWIALVPHLIGFEPADGEVVVIGIRADEIAMCACSRFADLSTAEERQAAVDELAGPVNNADIDAAAVIGYGHPEHIGATISALHTFLTVHDIRVVDAICVADNRYHPHGPANGGPATSDGRGVPFDATTTTVAATMVHAGWAPLPNRAALVEQFGPATGQVRAGMHAATLRAWHRLKHITARPGDARTALEKAGREAAATAYERHNNGDRLNDDEAAWLTVLLTLIPVRDHMLRRTHGHSGHVSLWIDLIRRADPDVVAAPATLLAFAAWRMGNGTIAAIAVDRALDADPEYAMARLLATALIHGLSSQGLEDHVVLAADPLIERPRVD